MSTIEQDHTVGRLGVVTIEDVEATAHELKGFTRVELAGRLGLKPVALGRFLAALIDAGSIERVTATSYRATGVVAFEIRIVKAEPPALEQPDVAEPDVEADESNEAAARDAVVALDRFTCRELADYLGLAPGDCDPIIAEMLARGWIREVGEWKGSTLLRYVRPVGKAEKRERKKTAEEIAVEEFGKLGMAGTAVHGGAPQPSKDKDVNDLVTVAWAAGWQVELRRKHAVVIPPGATRPIPVPGTPKGPGIVRSFRDQLRAAGLNVDGFVGDHRHARKPLKRRTRDAVAHV